MSKCDSCHKEKDDVKEVVDPYYQDVHGEKIMMKLCDNCYEISSDDI